MSVNDKINSLVVGGGLALTNFHMNNAATEGI